MRVVWKYDLAPGLNELPMPEGGEILTAAAQLDTPVIWAKVDPDRTRVRRTVLAVATGQRVDALGAYVGTALLLGGNFVLHIFDQGEG